MDPATANLLERVLLFGVAPLWLLSGSLDAACHRQQRMEHSTGTPESLLHLVMLFELGVGVLVALLLEPTAAAFVILYAAALTHEVTMWWDLAYAESRRRVPWFEQLVHGAQQALPWVALISLVLLHPAQALAVFGVGQAQADWRLALKTPPLPASYLLAFFGMGLIAVVWPFMAECWKCMRVVKAPPA